MNDLFNGLDFLFKNILDLSGTRTFPIDNDSLRIPWTNRIKDLKTIPDHLINTLMSIIKIFFHVDFRMISCKIPINSGNNSSYIFLGLLNLLIHVNSHYHSGYFSKRHVTHSPRSASNLGTHLSKNFYTNWSNTFTL
jgi:hypothetical protein